VDERTSWVHRVNSRLDSFTSDRDPILRAISPDLAPFAEFSRQFLSGGKRFRAQCAILGYRTVRPDVPDHLIDVASALEIFHAAALVHDDIMDKSDTRRGNPSAHVRFQNLHRESGWSGASADFGTSSALLLGDLLLAFSDELAAAGFGREADRQAARAARVEFDQMRLDVTAGQYLDIVEERAWPTVPKLEALSRAQRVVVFKSAKYSIEAPLVIGAALAGASTGQRDALRAIGLPLGVAFQLRDDVLGVFGDPAVTGKPAGDDLREGKRTVLVALAQARLGAQAVREMDALVGDPELSADQVAQLQNDLRECGALGELEAIIAQNVTEAYERIDRADLSEDARNLLRELADVVTNRAS
jgi:geranylgeranyl diphosphate synthase type I